MSDIALPFPSRNAIAVVFRSRGRGEVDGGARHRGALAVSVEELEETGGGGSAGGGGDGGGRFAKSARSKLLRGSVGCGKS